ncbi:hypothetical protein EVAR_21647_1 [Eumeta japonica]|uniref:Uncharacterized protein n=1 Tax=Eumeta variegata TaxID=151549 RepID=A0A4C1VIS6_EUMVA|nr:hypothetical protein EVAR_21647_1 [Eumeta japonica]
MKVTNFKCAKQFNFIEIIYVFKANETKEIYLRYHASCSIDAGQDMPFVHFTSGRAPVDWKSALAIIGYCVHDTTGPAA